MISRHGLNSGPCLKTPTIHKPINKTLWVKKILVNTAFNKNHQGGRKKKERDDDLGQTCLIGEILGNPGFALLASPSEL